MIETYGHLKDEYQPANKSNTVTLQYQTPCTMHTPKRTNTELFHSEVNAVQEVKCFTAFCKHQTKAMGVWWRRALLSPDGLAPSQMVGVCASVNLPLHHKVQRFSFGTSSPRWSRKKGRKMVVVVVVNQGNEHSPLHRDQMQYREFFLASNHSST